MTELALPDHLVTGLPASGRPKAAIEIATRLRLLIVQSARPGDVLPSERVLVERFSVSRPTVREALRVLEVEGLVEIRRGVYGGATVRDVGTTDMARMFGVYLQRQGATVRDLFDFRLLVEPEAAAQAATKYAQMARTRPLDLPLANLDSATDPESIASGLSEFHDKVMEIANNKALSAVLLLLREVIRQHYTTGLASQDRVTRVEWAMESRRAHAKIYKAIQAGDSKGAAEAMRRHLNAIRRGLDGSVQEVVQVLTPWSA